jgi:hypothetical protein
MPDDTHNLTDGRQAFEHLAAEEALWRNPDATSIRQSDHRIDIREAIDSLVASGHIEQARDANGDPVFRPNRQGVLEPVWVSTGKPL